MHAFYFKNNGTYKLFHRQHKLLFEANSSTPRKHHIVESPLIFKDGTREKSNIHQENFFDSIFLIFSANSFSKDPVSHCFSFVIDVIPKIILFLEKNYLLVLDRLCKYIDYSMVLNMIFNSHIQCVSEGII